LLFADGASHLPCSVVSGFESLPPGHSIRNGLVGSARHRRGYGPLVDTLSL